MTLKQVIHYPATNSLEATWIDAEGRPVRCRSYADSQLDELRVDLGAAAADYGELLALVADSQKPEAPPVLAVADFQQALDSHLNAPAQAKGYDSIHTAALRAAYPGPWHDEGLAFATWMDACNATGYQILADVQGGRRQPPASLAAFLAELPALVLP